MFFGEIIDEHRRRWLTEPALALGIRHCTGPKKSDESALFTIVGRMTGCYFSIRIDSETTTGVAFAMKQLKEQYGDKFSKVFCSITTDNGNEFAAFSTFEALDTEIYFAHRYSAWERAVNERTNRILRKFIPKGRSIRDYTDEQILMFAEQINSTDFNALTSVKSRSIIRNGIIHIEKLADHNDNVSFTK